MTSAKTLSSAPPGNTSREEYEVGRSSWSAVLVGKPSFPGAANRLVTCPTRHIVHQRCYPQAGEHSELSPRFDQQTWGPVGNKHSQPFSTSPRSHPELVSWGVARVTWTSLVSARQLAQAPVGYASSAWDVPPRLVSVIPSVHILKGQRTVKTAADHHDYVSVIAVTDWSKLPSLRSLNDLELTQQSGLWFLA